MNKHFHILAINHCSNDGITPITCRNCISYFQNIFFLYYHSYKDGYKLSSKSDHKKKYLRGEVDLFQ